MMVFHDANPSYGAVTWLMGFSPWVVGYIFYHKNQLGPSKKEGVGSVQQGLGISKPLVSHDS